MHTFRWYAFLWKENIPFPFNYTIILQVISQINRLNQPCIVQIDKKTARAQLKTTQGNEKKMVFLFSSCSPTEDALNILIIIMMMSSIILYRYVICPPQADMNNDQLFHTAQCKEILYADKNMFCNVIGIFWALYAVGLPEATHSIKQCL